MAAREPFHRSGDDSFKQATGHYARVSGEKVNMMAGNDASGRMKAVIYMTRLYLGFVIELVFVCLQCDYFQLRCVYGCI